MSTSHPNRDEKLPPPNRSTVVLLLGTIGDTTWRMFAPVIGLTILGIIGDHTFGSKPLCTILGVILGSVGAGLLIRQQLRKVNR